MFGMAPNFRNFVEFLELLIPSSSMDLTAGAMPNMPILPTEIDAGFELQNRLDRMLYVGLTEDHEESARLFAHMVGGQVLSQSATLNLDIKEDLPSGNGNIQSIPMAVLCNCVSNSPIYVT